MALYTVFATSWTVISGNSGRVTGVMAKWRGSPERSIATSASGTPFSQSVTVKFGQNGGPPIVNTLEDGVWARDYTH